jgi:Na+-transporting NADH:ubiquinone oxidoreductase subunit NqrE
MKGVHIRTGSVAFLALFWMCVTGFSCWLIIHGYDDSSWYSFRKFVLMISLSFLLSSVFIFLSEHPLPALYFTVGVPLVTVVMNCLVLFSLAFMAWRVPEFDDIQDLIPFSIMSNIFLIPFFLFFTLLAE